jgi:hypothetical protein
VFCALFWRASAFATPGAAAGIMCEPCHALVPELLAYCPDMPSACWLVTVCTRVGVPFCVDVRACGRHGQVEKYGREMQPVASADPPGSP